MCPGGRTPLTPVELAANVGRSLGELLVEIAVQNHCSDRAKCGLDLIEVRAFDREHSLLQFDLLATVLDGQKVAATFVHPRPGCTGLLSFDHLADVADLLIDPADQLLATLARENLIFTPKSP